MMRDRRSSTAPAVLSLLIIAFIVSPDIFPISRLVFPVSIVQLMPTYTRRPTPATPSTPTNITNPPKFTEEVLEGHRQNGYWVELIDITGNGLPDILAFGITEGILVWFENPYVDPRISVYNLTWKRRTIDVLKQPIGMDHRNIGGGMHNDFVVATEFGGSPYTIDNDGGKIFFYQNPLNVNGNVDDPWRKFYVGKAPGAHRIRLGYFTQTSRLQVLVVPVAGRFGDPFSPISVTLFTTPDDIMTAQQWESYVIDNQHFHLAHGVVAGKFRGDGLDSVIISSMEGIVWLYFDGVGWKRERIAAGVPRGVPSIQENARDTFWGCQNVDVGRIGSDPSAYIAVTGPFHGNVVLIYMKENGVSGTIANATWTEFYVHNFDSMTPNVDGSGPLHQIATADLDNDGDDELLIASKKKGTYYAKINDIGTGLFQITCLTRAPATRLAVADVDGDGILDFATIGNTISTETRHVDSKLNVYHNIKSNRVMT